MRRFLFSLGVVLVALPAFALDCPKGDARFDSGDVPLYQFNVGTDQKFVICALPNEKTKSGKTFLFEFSGHLFRNGKYVSTDIFGGYDKPSKYSQRSGELIETEFINIDGSYFPFYEAVISCSREKCERTKSKCIFPYKEVPKLNSAEEEAIAKRLKSISQKGKVDSYEDLVAIGDAALKGSSKAILFFTNRDRPSGLDGSWGEYYSKIQLRLRKMLADKCIGQNSK